MEEIVWWDGVKGRVMEEGLEDRETRPQAKQPSRGFNVYYLSYFILLTEFHVCNRISCIHIVARNRV